MKKLLSQTADWTFDLLEKYDKRIAYYAKILYDLDTYPNQIEVISSEQMMDAYSTVGMPVGYHHWSFGKQFLTVSKQYQRGQMGLAYEIVINSDPCIAYLMEENSMMMQSLVIAHACYGHNSFFKNNYLFKLWTDAESIIDYLLFAKNYISECESRYGVDQVENLLDACHALMNYGVDRYKHPSRLSLREEKLRQHSREMYLQSQVNDLWRTIPKKKEDLRKEHKKKFPEEPQENILYFIEKHAPLLEPWQREIVRIVRKIAQYFYPQRQTQVMNEGWACFWHYRLTHDLYEHGEVPDEFMLEFLQNHTNVIAQSSFDSPYFSGINPYTLGYNMMTDIRRICDNPTDEDRNWFPQLAGKPWLEQLDFAMRNFKDESFIAQYLSPHLIRGLKLFTVHDDDKQEAILVKNIHNESGYRSIREALSKQYNLSYTEPNIYVQEAKIYGDRSLILRYQQKDRRPLGPSTERILIYLHQLWGFQVNLETENERGDITHVDTYPRRA